MKMQHFLGLFLLCTGLFFTACQKDELAKPVGGFEKVTVRSHNCDEVCIDPADPVYHVHTASISNNSGPQTRVFNLSFYNTLTGFELEYTYEASNAGGRNLRVTVDGDGFTSPVVHTFECEHTMGEGSHTFNFNTSWAACDVVSFTAEILECGEDEVLSTLDGSYELVGQCAACEDVFDADLTCGEGECGNTLVITYSNADYSGPIVIQGGLTNGTTICSKSATGGLVEVTDHPAVINSEANVTRWIGNVEACETYTITIAFTGGNGVGGWSAKAGDLVLGSSEDQPCN